ncbi:hypothetical protein VHEMI10251 [[Torrubiella] hemipterigena]|uniref:Aminoglycoside phosphotransferase domain-containing protein n=1 Tax=[Torrubiella] hemipterigena TaxID=1531966 RepID=A0A0A1TRK7_9HYPO|nr:hypothetical protein VHEMI10251 [[Torrubiella] hemipterigena]
MAQLYSLNDSIDGFFNNHTSVTRQQCDDFVAAHFQTPAEPVPIQGFWSYTLMAGDDNATIIQFRSESSPLEEENLQLIKEAATGFVPDVVCLGTIGQHRPLHIYKMNKLPGSPYVLAVDLSIKPPECAAQRQENTIRDFAKFFAQSWNYNPPTLPNRAALSQEYEPKIRRLMESLPEQFFPSLFSVIPRFRTIFSDLPLVVTHGDLCGLNILINETSGHITGIIDWAEMRILPFGFALWGLENILGFMDTNGWHYYDNHAALRALFWETFRFHAVNFTEKDMALVAKARVLGLFVRYGFDTEDETALRVVDESDASTWAYLNAFCGSDGAN